MRFGSRLRGIERLESRHLMAVDLAAEPATDQAHGRFSSDDQKDMIELRAAEVRIQYDPREIQPDIQSIKAGPAWNGQASVIAKINEEAGIIVAFLFTANPTTGSGHIIEFDFDRSLLAAIDEPPAIEIDSILLNERQLSIASTELPLVKHFQKFDSEASQRHHAAPEGERVDEVDELPWDVCVSEPPSRDFAASTAWNHAAGRHAKSPDFIGPIKPDDFGLEIEIAF